jgi:hypothetical protein
MPSTRRQQAACAVDDPTTPIGRDAPHATEECTTGKALRPKRSEPATNQNDILVRGFMATVIIFHGPLPGEHAPVKFIRSGGLPRFLPFR